MVSVLAAAAGLKLRFVDLPHAIARRSDGRDDVGNEFALAHAVAGSMAQMRDDALDVCNDRVLHLHGLDDGQEVPRTHTVTRLDRHGRDDAGHWRRCPTPS